MADSPAEADELLDLVDDTDTVIGQILRRDANVLAPMSGNYVRAIHVFIMRGDGKLWIPVRGMQKTLAPGGLDFSVNGHTISGETYEQTALRELEEETGLVVSPDDLELVATIQPTSVYFARLYVLRTDVEPQLSGEHSSGNWIGINDLQTLLQQDTLAVHSLMTKLALLRNYLEQHTS
jgi:8-oxo-dGTP pyrophosphatase MutT (NUDIX family)